MKKVIVRSVLLAAIAGALIARTVDAAPLSMTNVSFPAINCLFDPTCVMLVTDTSASIPLAGAAGTAFLQSRTFKSSLASPAAGKWLYMYRIDLRNAVGIVDIPCLSSFSINFGPVTTMDFDSDGLVDDQVFVATSGGLGNVAPSSVTKVGSTVTFNFSSLVCAGGSPGGGDSTYFMGLVSSGAPKHVTATLKDANGPIYSVDARAPKTLIFVGGLWSGVFQSSTNPNDRGPFELTVDAQNQRRFAGVMAVNGQRFPFDGTISESGEFTAIGRGAAGRFEVHGEVHEMDGALTAEARYRLKLADGSVDAGTIALIRAPE